MGIKSYNGNTSDFNFDEVGYLSKFVSRLIYYNKYLTVKGWNEIEWTHFYFLLDQWWYKDKYQVFIDMIL